MNLSPLLHRRFLRTAALAAVVVFLTLIGRYYHPVYGFTALIQLDASNDDFKIAEFRRLPVYVHRDNGGYDGLYYAQIAYHPALDTPELLRASDNLSYRARRMLPATLAWLLAGGQEWWIARVYAALNIVAWLALAALLWRRLDVIDGRRWLAWAGVLFSAGALASVRLALTDLIALLFIMIAMIAAEKKWSGRAGVALAASALTRETSVLAVVAAWNRPFFSRRNLLLALGAWIPLGAWLLYVLKRVGPANQGLDNLTLPVVGFVEKWIEAGYAIGLFADWPLTVSTLLSILGLTVQGLFFIVHRDWNDRWWRLGAAYTALMFCLGTAVWEGFPGAATRVLLPMTLAFNVLASRARSAMAWLVLGNLTVFAGFVALRDPPRHPLELAAFSSHGAAGIAEIGAGWHGLERAGKHAWLWAAQHGTVRLQAWPQASADLKVQFRLRALVPRSVVVRQDGRELARFAIGTTLSGHEVTLKIQGGRAELEFATDAAPTRENANPDARALGFALYDLRLAQPDS